MFPSLIALIVALGLDEYQSRQLREQDTDPLLRQLRPLGFSSWQQAAWTLRVASFNDVGNLQVALLASGVSPRPLPETEVFWNRPGGVKAGWTVPEPLRSELREKQARLDQLEVELDYALRLDLEETIAALEAEHANLNDELLHASEELEIYQRGVEEAEGHISNPVDHILNLILRRHREWGVPDPESDADLLRLYLAQIAISMTPPGGEVPLPLRLVPDKTEWVLMFSSGKREQHTGPGKPSVRWQGQSVTADFDDDEVWDLANAVVGGQLRRRADQRERHAMYKDTPHDPELQAILDLSRLRAGQIPYAALAELRRRMDTETYGAWWNRRQVSPGTSEFSPGPLRA